MNDKGNNGVTTWICWKLKRRYSILYVIDTGDRIPHGLFETQVWLKIFKQVDSIFIQWLCFADFFNCISLHCSKNLVKAVTTVKVKHGEHSDMVLLWTSNWPFYYGKKSFVGFIKAKVLWVFQIVIPMHRPLLLQKKGSNCSCNGLKVSSVFIERSSFGMSSKPRFTVKIVLIRLNI